MQTLGGNASAYTQRRQCADHLLGVLCGGCVSVGYVHARYNSDGNIVFDTYEVDAQTLQERIDMLCEQWYRYTLRNARVH